MRGSRNGGRASEVVVMVVRVVIKRVVDDSTSAQGLGLNFREHGYRQCDR